MIDWFELHGIRIIIIVAIGLAVYLMFQYLIPRFVRRTVSTRMKDKPGAEIQKRTRTLSRVLRKTVGILVGIMIVFTILDEIGINIGPALAGLGVVGIAVGFGAQSLVKDVINGLFT